MSILKKCLILSSVLLELMNKLAAYSALKTIKSNKFRPKNC